MAGIDELINQEIEVKLDKRVAALESKITLLRPWIGMKDIEQLVGMKQLTITRTFIHNDGHDKEAKKLGLVKKINTEWRFKNPEFVNWLHDEYWKDV